ncbi:hypothetical protein Tco_0010837 [Tanacetum coccineum]
MEIKTQSYYEYGTHESFTCWRLDSVDAVDDGASSSSRLIYADDSEPSFKRLTKKPSVSTPSKTNEDVSKKRTDLEDSDVDETPSLTQHVLYSFIRTARDDSGLPTAIRIVIGTTHVMEIKTQSYYEYGTHESFTCWRLDSVDDGASSSSRLISANDLEPSFKRLTKKPSVSTPSKPNEDVSKKRRSCKHGRKLETEDDGRAIGTPFKDIDLKNGTFGYPPEDGEPAVRISNVRFSFRARGGFKLNDLCCLFSSRVLSIVKTRAGRQRQKVDMAENVCRPMSLPWVALDMGLNESGEYKKTFIGSGVGTGSMQVLHGFEFKAGLKDDMDARSDVYVLSNGCKKCSDNGDGYYCESTPAGYMKFTEAWKKEIWLKGHLTKVPAQGSKNSVDLARSESAALHYLLGKDSKKVATSTVVY